MSEIPIPPDSGSAGTQASVSGELARIDRESPLKGLPITQKVEGLAATHSRSMGGEVAANLIAGSFSQLSHDLQTTRLELNECSSQLRQRTSDLSDSRIEVAVLRERLTTSSRDRHLKNFCIFAGTTLIGIGIEFYKSPSEKAGIISGIFGIGLLIFGWVSSNQRSGE